MALQRQLREENDNVGMSISTIVERLFVNWMHQNLLPAGSTEADNANVEGANNSVGDISVDPATVSSDALPISEEAPGST